MKPKEMQDLSDALSELEAIACAVAGDNGAKWGTLASRTFRRKVMEQLGGLQVYIPRRSAEDRAERDAQVMSRFNGRNVRQLAREFALSERSVRRIVEHMGKPS